MALAVAGLLLAACGEAGDETTATATVRDSAGIAVVDNPPVGTGPTWSLGPEPTTEIGVVGGDPAYELDRVRDAVVMEDGRIAVVDGTNRVRVYGADGRHVADWGGEGDGPGEFRGAAVVTRWTGDSLAVWDRNNQRITVFDDTGALGRSTVVHDIPAFSFATFRGTLGGGRALVSSVVFSFGDEMPESGIARAPVALAVVDASGAQVGDLGTIPGDVRYLNVGEGTINIFTNPFQASHRVATGDGTVVVAATEQPSVTWLADDGSVERIAHLGFAPTPLTAADKAAEVERRAEAVPEERRAGVRRMFEDLPLPDSLPALDDLLVDRTGRVWARRFHTPDTEGTAEWLVLDAEGRRIATLAAPPGLDVYDIGEDWLLGRVTDDLGVERMQVWPLETGAAAGG